MDKGEEEPLGLKAALGLGSTAAADSRSAELNEISLGSEISLDSGPTKYIYHCRQSK